MSELVISIICTVISCGCVLLGVLLSQITLRNEIADCKETLRKITSCEGCIYLFSDEYGNSECRKYYKPKDINLDCKESCKVVFDKGETR